MKRKLITLLLTAAIAFGLMPQAYAADSFVVNAPENAVVGVYNQEKNYKTVKIDCDETTPLGDGTVDYKYNTAPTSNMSWRVSKDGEMTEAGYLNKDTERVVVDFADKSGSEALRKAYNAGILLNINERNKIDLDVGDSFTLRAYRAPWQIVNNTTSNIMIEPDFDYDILSGSDVIEITTSDNGNAGANKAEITAKEEGVAVIEVSCDAIYVDGIYPASSDRNAVAIVTVGDDYEDIETITWDNEYDTLYFTGDNGTISINTDLTAHTAKISDGALGEWEEAENGNAKIYGGNNILKVTDGIKTDYRVVKGSKLVPQIEGKKSAGEEITLSFDNIYQPIPKMAGLYNPFCSPSWGMPGIAVSYDLDENTVKSAGTAYYLNEKDGNKITFTIPENAENKITLTNGKITGENSVFGSAFGEHRKLTDDGIPANLNAASGSIKAVSLPDIEIELTGSQEGGDGNNQGGATLPSTPTGINKTHQISYYSTTVPAFEGAEADGYVTVSFTDRGVRNETCDFPTALGKIIAPTKVPFSNGDSVADVTVKLLDALGIDYDITGSVDDGFYLVAIKDFKLSDGYEVSSFGQQDGGSLSGWMVSKNNVFLSTSAADAQVSNGDNIKWQFTCQLGSDIGDNSMKGGSLSSVKPTQKEEEKKEEEEKTETDLAALEVEVYEIIAKKVPNPGVSSIGGEWSVFGLARSSMGINAETADIYLNNLCNYLKEKNGVLSDRKYTEYSRVITALTSIGKSAGNVEGYDLIAPLEDFDKTVSQGINGAVWAVIALDLCGYDGEITDKYIEFILDKQLSDWGWAMSGDAADIDMTAMALTALSKHTDDKAVSTAVDKGTDCLSKLKATSAESIAQMIVALCELGISLDDERFENLTEDMLEYYISGEGFCHNKGEEVSLMTTEQCFYAIVAAKRAADGRNTLFDMQGKSLFSDIFGHKYQEKIESLAERKIINGCGDGTFLPDGSLTRAECATIIVIALGLESDGVDIFDDVKKTDWFYDKVSAAYLNEIVMGISETLFNPNGNVTREEGAAFTERAAKLLGMNTDASESDDKDVSEWAKKSVGFCVENGIIDTDNGLRPKDELTRAEMANMVYNLLERVEK